MELTPPAFDNRSIPATEQLFSALSSIKDRVSLEIVSTPEDGIRFITMVDASLVDKFSRIVRAYLPETKITKAKSYLRGESFAVGEFWQARHYAYPINQHIDLSAYDPIGYLTNSMTRLKKGEVMAVQLVISPINHVKAKRLLNKILINDRLDELEQKTGVWAFIGSALNKSLFGLVDLITLGLHGSSSTAYKVESQQYSRAALTAKGFMPVRQISRFEQQLIASVQDKLSRPLFEVNIRVALS